MKGRVSSLLEVGTGFHPELTGRENIFLNGAILGMSRLEIKRKFDEIVAFSEIEKFIDTPVKRYSSGMYVRLAFAVAAHLEPEILILDEVLAVGDTSFQKKCLGKMGEVAREGRTVLFVSHQMPAIQNLCSRCVMLDRGRLVRQGTTKEVLDLYLSNSKEPISRNLGERQDRVGKGEVRVNCLEICDAEGRPLREAVSGKDIALRMHYSVRDGITLKNCRASVAVLKDLVPFALFSTDLVDSTPLTLSSRGVIEIKVADLPLSGGTYSLASFIASDGTCQDSVENAETMDVVDGDFFGTGKLYPDGWQGKTVLIRHSWKQHPEQSPASGVNSKKSPAFCTGVENPVL
jgi:lipopolysaccharide transport system ATP-binding protein